MAFAVFVIVIAALLTLELCDGSVFIAAVGSTVLGKYGYDASRDFPRGDDVRRDTT
jgi:hypothetical protein